MLNQLSHIYKYFFFASLVSLLSACATIPARQDAYNENISWAVREKSLQKIQNWNIQGAIALLTPQKKLSASIHWHQSRTHYQIHLFGPLGIGTTIIRGAPNKVTLQTNNRKIVAAHNPEDLMKQQLGWTLPLSNLYYWIRGIPTPTPAIKSFDQYHHLVLLKQDGWVIQYLHYTGTKQTDLPSKILISRPKLKLRIVISHWHKIA